MKGAEPLQTPAPADPASAAHLLERVALLETRLRQRDEQRRAMLHIMADLNDVNKRLGNQRKATLHILGDYEEDRRRLGQKKERLDNSRRALLHILQSSHRSNLHLEDSRKAMIHIMGDLRETTAEIQRREQELRDKQEQLVQAAKLATLGELTTGVAHELNNPLNNIGLFVGNAIDLIELGVGEEHHVVRQLRNVMAQVGKATQIISHLRTFGRAAPVSRAPVSINQVIGHALSLMQEQLRLHDIQVESELSPAEPMVLGNAIQLEQVLINLLTNARDAMADSVERAIRISVGVRESRIVLTFSDTGPGIPEGLEQRIFDPFFTTKEVGRGTGLGLSITYGIIQEHEGTVSVAPRCPGHGATFLIELPPAPDDRPEHIVR